MGEATIYIKEVINHNEIQQIEQLINQMSGIERVLIDTNDGEVKIEFDDQKVSIEGILSTLKQHNYQV
ncbi:heavy-metal-associated domain-containing protein [Ferdinandcohnia sp. Marseille-Q9671]